MASKPTMLTAEGHKKLEEELEFLQNVKRKEIAEKIKVARSYGDLSENSEYDDAKNEQAIMEARITQIESIRLRAPPVHVVTGGHGFPRGVSHRDDRLQLIPPAALAGDTVSR